MKFKFLFLIIIMVSIYSCGVVQNSISKEKLILYIPFNESIVDESGLSNDIQIVGATLTEDRFEEVSSAGLFNGFNNFLVVTDSDILSPKNNKLSISIWTKLTFPGDKFLLYKGSNLYNREYAMGIRHDSSFSFQINNNGSATNLSGIMSDRGIEEEKWYHIVSTWDGNVQKLYLNNELVNIAYPKISIKNYNSNLYIGSYGGAISKYAYDGSIDDLLIYNRVLNEEEIKLLYNHKIKFK